MKLRHVLAIWRKEVLDTMRDRRTMIAGILAPIIVMPLISLGSQALVGSTQQKAAEDRTPIAVVGPEHAPALMRLIDKSGSFKILHPADTEKALREGTISLCIEIPDGFEKQAMSGRTPAELTVDYEARKLTASVALGKFRGLLGGYIAQAQAARLGLADAGILDTVRITERNVSTPKQMGGMMLGFFVPFVLALWGIMGGMYTAIDAVAGEKERRTLESLIITPPDRAALAAGKSLAVFTMAALTILLSLASVFLSYRYGLPLLNKSGQMSMSLDPGSLGLLLLVSLPYLAMLGGLEIALSSFGRTFKETQNYFSALMFAVMIPGMALVFLDTSLPLVLYAAPLLNAVALFKGILAETWRWSEVVLCVLSNLIYLVLTLGLARKMLSNEKAIFRG